MKNLKRGFTLIELLVVIAIIGILSSVVLASLNTARTKGADTAVKANLSNIKSQAELVYSDTAGYLGVCADLNVVKGLTAAQAAGAGAVGSDDCVSSSSAWAASAQLKSTGHWCVDSAGTSRTISAALGTTATVCPAN